MPKPMINVTDYKRIGIVNLSTCAVIEARFYSEIESIKLAI